MAIKKEKSQESRIEKERFEFVVTINGNFVCQRFFRINGFNPESLTSFELKNAIERCVRLIQDDLRDKTDVYLSLTAPQIFNNAEEMHEWLPKHKDEVKLPLYIILRDSEEVFVYTLSHELKPYTKYFNRFDFLKSEDEKNTPCEIKFTFYDNGEDMNEHKEVISKIFDGNVYPRFVRSHIDLSNSKNKYRNMGVEVIMESLLIDALINERPSLIPKITAEIASVCSGDETRFYRNRLKYGGKTYFLDLDTYNERLFFKKEK